ncbi:hypothetical protein KXV58_006010, partial [Aspergillus fumigatus]
LHTAGAYDDNGNYSEWGHAFVWTVTVDLAASQAAQAAQAAAAPNTDPGSQAGCLMAGNITFPNADGEIGGTPICNDNTVGDTPTFVLCFLNRIKPAHTVLNRQRYGAQQTYVKDASAPGMSDGTVLDAAFYNRIISNLEYVVSQGGAAGLPPGSVNALHQGILGVIGEGAPGNLQTVAQLAAAINDDPQVWTTLTGQINACVRFDKNQT